MQKQSIVTNLFLFFVFSICGLTNAENWARFRGPNGQGHSLEKGLPVKWSTEDYLWTVELAGMGHSSPVIYGQKVFITSATKDNSTMWLAAYNTGDGKELWSKEYKVRPAKMNRLNSAAASTPAVDDKCIYSLWYGEDTTLLTALDHRGNEIWSRDFGGTSPSHGPCTSPILYKGLVIFTQEQNENSKQPESKWLAVNKTTGDIEWTVDRGRTSKGSYSVPCIYTDKNGKDVIIFASHQHGITAVEPEGGKIVWEAKDIFPERVVSSPVICGDIIIGTCGTGGGGKQLAAVRVPAKSGEEAEVLYTLDEKFVPYVSTGIAAGNLVFFFHDQGKVTCLEGTTGEVKWSEKPAGKYYSSPVCADGKLYCMDMEGKAVVLRAASSYEVLGITDLGEETQASVAIADGKIFLRTLTHLISIENK
jgi:outer membrane protein assembly factor BamB